MIKKSPYEVLNLEGDFDYKDIKKAYRKAVRKHPPEKEPEKFSELSDAFEMLTNEEYFMKSMENTYYLVNVDLESQEPEKPDMSKYLKTIFEVPFTL